MALTAEQEAVLAAYADRLIAEAKKAEVWAQAQADIDAIEAQKTARHDAAYAELEAIDAKLVPVAEVVKVLPVTPVKG
jgi:hypothetical protein